MKSSRLNKRSVQILVTSLAVGLFACLLHFAGAFTWLEHKSYDSRTKFSAHFQNVNEKVGLILIDQQSLDWAKKERGWGWPWPRQAYAEITDFCRLGNVSSLAFDMVFSEDSVYGPADDESFAAASREYGKVIQTVYYDSNGNKVLPVPSLEKSAALIANVTSTLDNDGIARRSFFYSKENSNEAGMAAASLKVSGEKSDFSEIPAAEDGGMYIRYLPSMDSFFPYNAEQILRSYEALKSGKSDESLLKPEDFQGMHLFLGVYAPGLFDICSTPISATAPGIGVHASQLNTILNGNFLQDFPAGLVIAFTILFALLGSVLGLAFTKGFMSSIIRRVILFLLLITGYMIFTYVMFNAGTIMPVSAPAFAITLSFVAAISVNYVTEGAQKRYLKAAFSQYLSPTVINNLIENPGLLKLGGEKREITAYFSDVQGFTTISEGLEPDALTELLNIYLSAMTDIILDFGGTIDKYEGDAIIAFWNAPTYQKDHAKRALEAALECQKKLLEMQEELVAKAGKPFKQRIGLNTGYAVIGNMGSRKRFDYTMLGDTVNLASRLEGINKQFGTYTMCSEATKNSALENGCKLAFHEVGNIAVVGRKEGVRVYNPMDVQEFENSKNLLEPFDRAYGLFTKGDFSAAREIFVANANFSPCEKYIEKCDKLIKNPPANWDGVIRATEK